MDTSYSKKEFIKAFDSEEHEVSEFFKRIDTNTMRGRNFFDFYKIQVSSIKDENSDGFYYKIPAESAHLLASMIRAYPFSYGYDRRGRKKGSKATYSYEQYHNYIETLKSEIEKLPYYQQELIKNHRAYINAELANAYIPLLVERLTVLLFTLFDYGDEMYNEDFMEMVDFLDQTIENLIVRRAKYQEDAKTGEQSKIAKYTFEDAISGVFRLLANDKSFSPETEVSSLYYPELLEIVAENKAETTDSLNQLIKEFYLTHANENMDHETRMKAGLDFANSFWSMEANISRMMLNWQKNFSREIEVAFDIANRCGHYSDLGKDIKSGLIKKSLDVLSSCSQNKNHENIDMEHLSISDCNRLIGDKLDEENEKIDQLIKLRIGLLTFDEYQYDFDILTYSSDANESLAEFKDKAIKQLLQQKQEEYMIGAKQQSELQADEPYQNLENKTVLNYYHTVKAKPEFGPVQKAFADIMTSLLTSQFEDPLQKKAGGGEKSKAATPPQSKK